MAAHPLAMSCVRAFVDTAVEWAWDPWDTTVDIPFIIAIVEDQTIIFDLRCYMQVPNGDPVFMADSLIGPILK